MIRNTLLITALALSVSAYAADSTLSYQGSLSSGVDKALSEGWTQVASTLTIDHLSPATAAVAGQALLSASISGNSINLVFDEQKLKAQLASGGHASWSGLKDPILIWLADVNEGHMVGGGTDHAFAKALTDACSNARFELMFPLMDLDDVQQVSTSAVLTHNDAQVTKASRRYAPKFFIASAMEQSGDNTSFKWNLYDDGGRNLGSGESSGSANEVVNDVATAIARVLMDNVSADSQESADASSGSETAVAGDPLALGPGQGFVRVLITGISNIQDLTSIRRQLITFGYEASSSVSAWLPEGVIFEVPTGASASILDGTLAHASGFSKIGNWMYSYSSGITSASSGRDGRVGTPSYKSATLRSMQNAAVSNLNGRGAVTPQSVQPVVSHSQLVED